MCLQVLSVSDPTLLGPVAVELQVTQQPETLVTALKLLREHASVKSFKSAYNIQAIWKPVLALLHRNAGQLQCIGLNGSRSLLDATELIGVLQLASNLQEVRMINLWSDALPSGSIVGTLAECHQLRCGSQHS